MKTLGTAFQLHAGRVLGYFSASQSMPDIITTQYHKEQLCSSEHCSADIAQQGSSLVPSQVDCEEDIGQLFCNIGINITTMLCGHCLLPRAVSGTM